MKMDMNLDIAWKSLNKKQEELCGDTVEIIKGDDADFLILSDGMGSGVKANILSTLTAKILGTMLKQGASLQEAISTVVKTLPVDSARQVAYSTFSILKIYHDGRATFVEYDNPDGILIRNGRHMKVPYTTENIEGKEIRVYNFHVNYGDYYIMMSDGVSHSGVGRLPGFGWQMSDIIRFTEKVCAKEVSSNTLMTRISNECFSRYGGVAGDDSTVITIKVTEPTTVNIFTGPPVRKDDDAKLMAAFMAEPGKKVVCGGTTANIASRYLGKPIKASLMYYDPDIPPTAEIEGLDLVTEGVLTLNRTVEIMRVYTSGRTDDPFFYGLYGKDGATILGRLLIEHCTHLNMFVGRTINETYQSAALPFDLSIRQRLVEELKDACEKMGKTVSVKYY